MNNRIINLFKQKNKQIVSVYFTAGYPNLNDTVSIVQHLEKAEADMVEIGFPFSDPLADGPTIQQSSGVAIDNGMTVEVLFNQLKNIRSLCQIPIVLMGYLNPMLQYGQEKFIEQCAAVGVDGLIIPDMPLDYYEQHLKSIFEKNNLSKIFLITPNTCNDRIKTIDALSSGFVYMVSSNSITGGNKALNEQQQYFERIKNMQLNNPTLIGFGIHNAETFNTACQYSNGAIVGTAFIKHLQQQGVSESGIKNFVQNLRG